MASLNKVMLIGNLGQDPDVRSTPNGQTVANFSLATTERWKDKQTGNQEEKTEWHRIVVWGRLAELCRDYLSKGRSIYVEGRLQTRSWEDKDGNKKYTTETIAQTIQFLGKREGAGQNQGATQATPAAQTSGPPPFDADDDIPF